MSKIVYGSRLSRMKGWMVRSGLSVLSGLTLGLSSLLGGALLANVSEKAAPGISLLCDKLVSTMGGRFSTAALTLLLLVSSQQLWGRRIHLRQREYDNTAQRVLGDLCADPAAPVPDFYLYLRAFETTGKLHVPLYLRVRRKCIWVAQRLVTDDVESFVSLSVGRGAPLIAFGRPGEAIGAGRIVTDEESWKKHILVLMRRAKGILLVPSDRPGTLWEMKALRQEGLLGKVVFIMPPLSKGEFDTQERWNSARAIMATHGLEAPEHQERGMLFAVGADGKVSNAEPLLLSSPRKIRKSVTRLFKAKRSRSLYKAYAAADKRAGRGAFWGWAENARQLSIFPVIVLAVFMSQPNVGFDPKESWATVLDRSTTAREISDFELSEAVLLGRSGKYQRLEASVPPEKLPELQQALLVRGLSRLDDESLHVYYTALGEMLANVSEKTCAAIVTGEIQPAAMQNALTYIPSKYINGYLQAKTAAIVAAAEDRPAVPLDKNAEAKAWQQLTASLTTEEQRRYEQLDAKQGTVTAKDQCWVARTTMLGVAKLHEPHAASLARALASGEAADEPSKVAPEIAKKDDAPAPSAVDTTKQASLNPAPDEQVVPHDNPPRAAVVVPAEPSSPLAKSAPESSEGLSPNRPVSPVASNPAPQANVQANAVERAAVPASIAQVPPPDPNLEMEQRAYADMAAGRLVEPANDCALYWAQQLKQRGDPKGAIMERSVLETMAREVDSARARGDYNSALQDVDRVMQFYPGSIPLAQLKSQIENERQRQLAAAQIRRFVLQHRHLIVTTNGQLAQGYCVGVLLVAPDGSARFDCTMTYDPQGRCDHAVFPAGTIKEVKFLRNGLLHVATTRTGNFDFYGAALDLQGAYQGLVALAQK